jgi:hypothetical protein
LALGQNTVFNMLTETQQYVSSLVFNEVLPPLAFWSEDYTRLTIKGETLGMEQFRSTVQELFRMAWAALLELTGGRKFANKLPDSFKDDLCNDARGYSFLDHGPFTETPNAFLTYLVRESGLDVACLDGDGNLSWNVPVLHKILGKTAEVNRIIMLLCFILPSMSNRLTQFIDQKIRNGDRPRNLHMLGREMLAFTNYHKMTNLTGLDMCIPAFYPPPLTEIMVEYLCGGMSGVSEIFSGVVHGPESAALYHTYASYV